VRLPAFVPSDQHASRCGKRSGRRRGSWAGISGNCALLGNQRWESSNQPPPWIWGNYVQANIWELSRAALPRYKGRPASWYPRP